MKTKYKIGIGIISLITIFGILAGMGYNNGKDVIEQNRFGIVSSTEYWSGETGMAIARFVNWQGNPISVINCTLNTLYPDNTWFIQGQLMSTNNISGDHYGTFTVPTTEGIYDYSVTCYYTQGSQTKSRTASKTFHVNPSLNYIKVLNSTQQTMLSELDDIDLNLTNIYSDTQYVRNNMLLDLAFRNNMTHIEQRFDGVDNNLSVLKTYCDDAETNNSQLCQLVTEMNNKIISINFTISNDITNFLTEINQTTHNTYDYVTGTLATNINTLLTDTGIIKTTTTQINTTVTATKNNTQTLVQYAEEEVNLNIVS